MSIALNLDWTGSWLWRIFLFRIRYGL